MLFILQIFILLLLIVIFLFEDIIVDIFKVFGNGKKIFKYVGISIVILEILVMIFSKILSLSDD